MFLILSLGGLYFLLLILCGWLCALFGPTVRYFYFFSGIFLGLNASFSFEFIGVSFFLLLVSFWIFRMADRLISSGQAASHVPDSVTRSTSGFCFGLFIGIIISIIKFYI